MSTYEPAPSARSFIVFVPEDAPAMAAVSAAVAYQPKSSQHARALFGRTGRPVRITITVEEVQE